MVRDEEGGGEMGGGEETEREAVRGKGPGESCVLLRVRACVCVPCSLHATYVLLRSCSSLVSPPSCVCQVW